EYRETLSEALRHTLRRLELVEEMRDRRGPEDVREAARAGIPPLWFAGARTAVRRYPPSDLAPFREALGRAARELLGEPAYAAVRAVGQARVTRTVAPEPAAAPSAAVRAEEASFLDIVDDLAERSADGYADLREAMQLAERRGVTGDRAEELLNALEESGVLEEPIVGKLRRA
ncbi:MAG: hypothetical protein L3J91_00430, partial [Thermoplasmata archaeon]|nr:hypothetical protein [Thermoplasmata archaeon]